MSSMADRADLAIELRLQIDELATTLILNGPGVWLKTTFQQLTAAATLAGYAKIAQIASEILSQLPAGEEICLPGFDELLGDGLARIQQLLESAAEEAEAPGEPEIDVPVPAAKAPQSFSSNPLAQDPDLVGDFIMDAREHLGLL